MTKTQIKIRDFHIRAAQLHGASRVFLLLYVLVLEMFVAIHKIFAHFVFGKHKAFEKFACRDVQGAITDSYSDHERFHKISLSSVTMVALVSVMYVLAGVLAPGPHMLRAASLIVNDNGDAGDGTCDSSCTLRDAIENANSSPGADVITFDSATVITPTSPLPDITETVSIDGDVDSNGTPDVVISGGAAGATSGITIASNDVTISGLVIQGFSGDGISIIGSNNVITRNYIGTNSTATSAATNTGSGITIADDTIDPSSNNVIGGTSSSDRNIISGNTQNGVKLSGSFVTDNDVQGNYIGTNAAGTSAIPNGQSGIRIESSASSNIIGGSVGASDPGTAPGNLISGNTSSGVILLSDNNQVAGNIIGLNASGTAALANSDGFTIAGSGNTVGGASTSFRNIISGNANGVTITAGDNTVQYNYIGTNIAGDTARANSSRGVRVSGGLTNIYNNLVAGNPTQLYLQSDADIKGNIVGLNAVGSAAFGSQQNGVYILAGTVTVGSTSSSDRNVIAGNSSIGIAVIGSGPRATIQGNYIGTDATGATAIANGMGIGMVGGATGNSIGDTNSGTSCTGACNVISGNTTDEIFIDSGAHGNTVQGNYIGVNALGTKPISWTASGAKHSIHIQDNSYNNQIGGSRDENVAELGDGNLISGNQQSGGAGIYITLHSFNGTTGNPILGNLIGTSPTGAFQDSYNNTTGAAGADGINDFRNAVGFYCIDSSYCSLGDGTTAHANLISGNGVGVQISNNPLSTYNLNYIGTNKTATLPFSNSAYQGQNGLHFGIYFNGGHDESGSVVENNIISGFYKADPDLSGGVSAASMGIAVGLGSSDGSGELRNITFLRNKIGTDIDGTSVIKNNVGFYCFNGGNVEIGSSDINDRNIISGNGEGGVGGPFETLAADGYCRDITIEKNYFGTDINGNTSLGNGNSLNFLAGSGAITVQDNVIGSSEEDGVRTVSSTNNYIGNKIGVGADGTTNLANAADGISVDTSGAMVLQNNVIRNNGQRGVHLTEASATIDGNTVSNNTGDGITLDDSNSCTITDNTITDNGNVGINMSGVSESAIGTTGHGNTVTGHAVSGLVLSNVSHTNTVIDNTISSNDGDANGAGISINESFNNTVSNNTLDQNARGVLLRASDSFSTYENTVTQNEITNSTGSGVVVQNPQTQGNTISNNTISANHAYGIDNETTHSSDDPTPTGGDNVIDSNTLSLNLLSGIRNYGASPAITNNTFTQNVKSGVSNVVNYGANTNPSTASDDTTSLPEITGNTFNGNQEYGIYSLDTAPSNKDTLKDDNTFDDNNTLGRIRQEWYGLVKVTVEGVIQDAASVDIFDNTESDNLASLVTAATGYAPDTASLTDVQTWEVVPEFQVSPTGTLQAFSPHKVIAAVDGDAETVTFKYNGVNDSGEVGPTGFGNTNGRYQVALVNITKVPNTVHGTVFTDVNENGTNDSEAGKSGVAVTLYKSTDTTFGSDTAAATTTTASDGTYTFSGVVQGNYFVKISTPTNYADTTSNPGSLITFASENETKTQDFGVVAVPPPPPTPSGTIRGTVFQDTNKNKVFEGGELGLSGIEVSLYNDSNANGAFDSGTDQLLATRTTNTSGVYRFIGIGLRNYFLTVQTPTNRSLTTANSPTDLLKLDVDGETLTQDFGFTALPETPTPEPKPTPKPGSGGGTKPIINPITGGSNVGIVAPRTGASATNSFVAIAAVVLAAINVLTAAGSGFPLLLRLLFDLFTEPLMALFGAKKEPWGKLFDSITNEPIDLGIVRLYDANTMKLTATAVTDRTGRFKFFPKRGSYVAKADKKGYIFPSSLLKSAPGYQKPNLYFGDRFNISDQNQTFNRDVPLDRESKEGSEKLLLKLHAKRVLRNVFAYSGIVIGIVNMVVLLSWLTFGIFVVHVILFAFFWRITRPRKPKTWGIVYDEETKKPIAGAVVRIFDQRFGRLLDATLSNRNGKFGFLIGPSTYYLTVEAKEYIFPGTRKSHPNDYVGGPIEIKDANQVVSSNIPLRKKSE